MCILCWCLEDAEQYCHQLGFNNIEDRLASLFCRVEDIFRELPDKEVILMDLSEEQ